MRNSIQAEKPSFNSEQIDEIQLPPNQKTNEVPFFEHKKHEQQAAPFVLEEIPLRQEDLEKVAIIYDMIREIQREFDPELDKTLADQFDEHVKNIMFDLNNKLKNDLPLHFINTNITKVQRKLSSSF